MSMLGREQIADGLRDADFAVEASERHSPTHGQASEYIRVADCDRDVLERVVAALAGGYRVEINAYEPGYEVVLQEDA